MALTGQQTQQPSQPFQQVHAMSAAFIESEAAVDYYTVVPGSEVLLICLQTGKQYLKTVAPNGMPYISHVYSFKEENIMRPYQNADNFVTRDQFDELSGKLDALIKSLGGEK